MQQIVINGRFLHSGIARTGVFRVANEMMMALDALLAEQPALAERVSCRVIVPGDAPADLRLSRIRVEAGGSQGGYRNGLAWEHLVLPWLARGTTVLSFCNVGPLLHRDAYTMIHDAQVFITPDSYPAPFRAWYRFLLPRLGRRHRGIFTVSDYSRTQLAEQGVARRERIHVVHNGCDHVLRLKPDASVLAQHGLAERGYVVALANTQAHKNIGVLLRAFALPELAGCTLALFGSATREDFEAQGHAVPANVRFLGRISDEALAALLQHALALAFPSLTEGFGLPPLEAMALGCPVVAAPCGALPEACGDAVSWADPHEPVAWAQQLQALAQEPELAARARLRGQAHAARFTWSRAARQVLETVCSEPLPLAPSATNLQFEHR